MRRLTFLACAILAGLMLAGCGIRGDLERPAPVWGPDERTPAERSHESEDAATDDNEVESGRR